MNTYLVHAKITQQAEQEKMSGVFAAEQEMLKAYKESGNFTMIHVKKDYSEAYLVMESR